MLVIIKRTCHVGWAKHGCVLAIQLETQTLDHAEWNESCNWVCYCVLYYCITLFATSLDCSRLASFATYSPRFGAGPRPSVSIVARLQAGWPGFNSHRGNNGIPSHHHNHHVQTGSEVHPASHPRKLYLQSSIDLKLWWLIKHRKSSWCGT
jgi:hypothetical protein